MGHDKGSGHGIFIFHVFHHLEFKKFLKRALVFQHTHVDIRRDEGRDELEQVPLNTVSFWASPQSSARVHY